MRVDSGYPAIQYLAQGSFASAVDFWRVWLREDNDDFVP